jgi:hypothetical protein
VLLWNDSGDDSTTEDLRNFKIENQLQNIFLGILKKVILRTPKRTKSNSFSDTDRLVSDTPPVL